MNTKWLKQHPNVPQPDYVWYCDKPLNHPSAKPIKITINELEAIIGDGFQFCENVFTTESFRQQFTPTLRTDRVKEKVLERVRSTLNDKLVICNMGHGVGHGLFARESIAMGDVIAIYNGLLAPRIRQNRNEYAFDVSDASDSSFSIDAAHTGGLARFLQHLPYNPDYIAKKLIPLFKNNTALIQPFLEIDGSWNELDDDEKPIILTNLIMDVTQGTGQHILGMQQHNANESELFEKNNVLFEQYHQVAFANCQMSKLVIDQNKPIMYVYALFDIDAGTQLGFSYGIGYWANRGLLPLLFDTQANVIPRSDYHYQKMPITMTLPNNRLKAIPFTKAQYQQQIGKHEAVMLTPYHAVSFFKIRTLLANNNVLSTKHAARRLSLFAQQLQALLPDDVQVDMFERFPDSVDVDNQYIFDVVCKTNDFQRWAQLTQLIRNDSIIGGYCKSLRYSGEVIIQGANLHPKALYQFIKRITQANTQLFFNTTIPKSQLPDDPGYDHPFPHLK